MPLNERMDVLAALECVDFVTSFSEDTPLEIIKKIKPSWALKGGNYQPEDVVGYGIVDVIVSDLYNGLSTTDKILKANA